MKVKVADLWGIPLAYAVAMAEGRTAKRIKMLSGVECPPFAYVRHPDGQSVKLADAQFLFDFDSGGFYHPHTSHGIGGPIIEREHISTRWDDEMLYGQPQNRWLAEHHDLGYAIEGPTKLIAGMRCYVASKLGDEVEVPEELS